MTKTQRIISLIFGASFLLLSFLIVTETLLRKFFNVSLQGVDELSGYVLAFGATLAFSSALLSSSHMRIDLIYRSYPKLIKVLLNVISLASLMVLAAFLAYVSIKVLEETRLYGSTASTPWATPLDIPQGFWVAGFVMFALAAAYQSVCAVRLLLAGDTAELNQRFGPKGVKEEIDSEVASLIERTHTVPENYQDMSTATEVRT